jgi:hypothetical protein
MPGRGASRIMNAVTLTMVMNRWPETLHDALAVLDPYVHCKVAIVDRSAAFSSLDKEQASRCAGT